VVAQEADTDENPRMAVVPVVGMDPEGRIDSPQKKGPPSMVVEGGIGTAARQPVIGHKFDSLP